MSGSPLPPGRIETLGGRSVHWTRIEGPDVPVLLLGGCGVPATMWAPVLDSRLLRSAEPIGGAGDETADGGVADEETSRGSDRLGGEIVLLDRPGMGGSRWPGTLPTLAEEVATLVDLLKLLRRPAVVVGHSMGGPHAEALARIRPESVHGLVLLDASMGWHPRPSRLEGAWLRAAKGVHLGMRVPLVQTVAVGADKAMVSMQSRRVRLALMPPWAGRSYRDPETVASVIAEQAAYGRQLRDLSDVRAEHAWPGTPTIVLTATGDGESSWESDQARYARLLGAEQRVLPDSNHLIMLDRPDAVVAAVRRLRG